MRDACLQSVAKEDMRLAINHRAMVEDVSRTLENLKTDYLDIWFSTGRSAVPADEIIDMAQHLIDKKLTKHLGASTGPTADRTSERMGERAEENAFFHQSDQWSLAHCTRAMGYDLWYA